MYISPMAEVNSIHVLELLSKVPGVINLTTDA